MITDNRLVDDARAFVTVIASDVSELTYEQLRTAFLRIVPELVAEIEILSAMKVDLPLPVEGVRSKRNRRRKGGRK